MDANIKIINRGSIEDLEKLEGVDRVMAEKIINYRELNGDFKHLEELIRIPGVTSEMIQALKNTEKD